MVDTTDILFEEIAGEHGSIAVITLNRPQVLNALNHIMFRAMRTKLKEWEYAKHIKAVVLRAVGRAFCAGGDIRLAYEYGKAGDAVVYDFFNDEYDVNQLIYNYNKPFISLMNGLTMGGGAGISITGSHRVVTNNFSFAMPETAIGFYPDVGMGYFLTRLPFKMGYYLGLTGARIAAEDSLALGLVDVIVAPESFDKIIEELVLTKFQDEAQVSEIINYFALPVVKPELLDHQAEVQTCFSKESYEEIFEALEHYPSPWCEIVAASINTKSPTSLKVTFQQLEIYSRLSFDECMDFDRRLTRQFVSGKDFYEGVRAAIIEKDQSPRWSPSHVADVSNAEVDKYFQA